MNKRLWLFQQPKELRTKGPDKASWYVGWYDQNGSRRSESCGPGLHGKNLAEKWLRRIQSELDTGLHQLHVRKTWAEFQTEYTSKILAGLAPRTKDAAMDSLGHFVRILAPKRIPAITTAVIDEFIATRRQEKGLKPGSLVSPATINKDLRHLKAVLKIAYEWGYLPEMPKVRMVKEPQKLPTYVTPDHFNVIYGTSCQAALLPRAEGLPYAASDWWKALVVTAYMTGLRIGELLAIRKEDLDLNRGVLIARWDDTKADRDEVIELHSLVVDHLRAIGSNQPKVFPWPHNPRTLWVEFTRIQREAGIHLPCRERHDHTPSCHVYGFHDFRRAFATTNAPRLKPEVLQRLMRHKSYATTLKYYVNPTNQIQDAVANLPVPEILRQKKESV